MSAVAGGIFSQAQHACAPFRGMFNKEVIGKMKKGAYLVNNARGSICDPDAVTEALKSGHLAGCASEGTSGHIQ